MNKKLLSALFVVATGLCWQPTFAAKQPTPTLESLNISEARVDNFARNFQLPETEQVSAQLGQDEAKNQEILHANAKNMLIKLELIKKLAIEEGMVDEDFKNLIDNVVVQIYNQEYIKFLGQKIQIPEAEIRAIYDTLTQEIKYQFMIFKTLDEANAALTKLKKGASFKQLSVDAKPLVSFFEDAYMPYKDAIAFPNIGGVIRNMSKGQVYDQPIELKDGFILLKIADLRPMKDAPSYATVKESIVAQERLNKALKKMDEIFADYGLE